MRNSIIFYFFLVSIVGCSREKIEINPKVDSYPMTTGTEWTYDRQLIIKRYESETSDKFIDTEIYNFTVKVWIDKDTLLNDSMNVKLFKAEESNNNGTLIDYKFIDNEGLKTYAYSISGGNIYAKKKGTLRSPYFLFINILLSNMIHIDDEIMYEDQPTLDIKLPLDNNSSWTYRHPTRQEIPQIDKEVIGTERLNLIGENFDCYKVIWNYVDKPINNGINITDWISDKGLIKRIIFSDRIILRTELGEYNDETAQVIETLVLKELKIF